MSIRTQRSSTRLGAAAIIAALVASLFAFASPAGAQAVVETDRVFGADRYATAADIATEAFPAGDLDNILLASGENFPDALAGNGLAGAVGAPILLTEAGSLSDAASDAIEALAGVDATVHILGGSAAVATSVDAEVEALGVTVNRVFGADRYATAAEIAELVDSLATIPGLNGTTTVIVATGENFPDALAGGPLAYDGPHPILLTEGDDLSDATAAAIEALGADEVVILGGTAAVSDDVAAELETLTGNDAMRVNVTGGNRYSTAAAIADVAIAEFGFDGSDVLVAQGTNFPDALAGGPLGGATEAPILLTPTASLASETAGWLSANASTVATITALGGTAAVSDTTLAQAEAAAETFAGIAVSPSDAAVVTDDGVNDTRQYTVTASAGTDYEIALYSADDISVSDAGAISFEATPSAVNSQITVVNGIATGGSAQESVTATGDITFTVEGNGFENVVPVVFIDENDNGVLDVNADGLAEETYGLGGALAVFPEEADTGALPGAASTILYVNKDANFLVALEDAGPNTYRLDYEEGDLFYVDGTAIGNRVTMAQFEAVLTAGDTLDVANTEYSQNFESTFVLNNVEPNAPTIDSVDAEDDNATVTVSGVNAGATVRIYGAQEAAGGDVTAPVFADTTLLAQSAADADADTAEFQIELDGLDPEEDYQLYATQVVDGEESSASGGAEFATTAAASDLTLESATPADVNDGAGSTANIVLTFSEAVDVADVTQVSVSPTNQPGIVYEGTVVASGDGTTTVTVTVDTALNDASNDVSYTVTVSAGAVVEAGGASPNTTQTATFSY